MDVGVVAMLIPIVAIIGGITVAVVGVITRARVRELEIKERIAMIERGMVPAPEVDPRGFDRVMNRLERRRHEMRAYQRGSGRHRRAGVTLIGVGLGLMVLIAFSGGDVANGLGVGGFLVVIGIAFLINSLLEGPTESHELPSPVVPTPPAPAEPSRRD